VADAVVVVEAVDRDDEVHCMAAAAAAEMMHVVVDAEGVEGTSLDIAGGAEDSC